MEAVDEYLCLFDDQSHLQSGCVVVQISKEDGTEYSPSFYLFGCSIPACDRVDLLFSHDGTGALKQRDVSVPEGVFPSMHKKRGFLICGWEEVCKLEDVNCVPHSYGVFGVKGQF